MCGCGPRIFHGGTVEIENSPASERSSARQNEDRSENSGNDSLILKEQAARRAREVSPTYTEKQTAEFEDNLKAATESENKEERQAAAREVRQYTMSVFETLSQRFRAYEKMEQEHGPGCCGTLDRATLPTHEQHAFDYVQSLLKGAQTPPPPSSPPNAPGDIGAVVATSIKTRFKPSINYGVHAPYRDNYGAAWMGDPVVRCNDGKGATGATGALAHWWRIGDRSGDCSDGKWRWIPTRVVTYDPSTGKKVIRPLITTEEVYVSSFRDRARRLHHRHPEESEEYWKRYRYAQQHGIEVIQPPKSLEDKLGACLLSGIIDATVGSLIGGKMVNAGYSTSAADIAGFFGGSITGSIATDSDVFSGLIASAAGKLVGGGPLGFAVSFGVCIALS